MADNACFHNNPLKARVNNKYVILDYFIGYKIQYFIRRPISNKSHACLKLYAFTSLPIFPYHVFVSLTQTFMLSNIPTQGKQGICLWRRTNVHTTFTQC